jgi:hypothetical protein
MRQRLQRVEPDQVVQKFVLPYLFQRVYPFTASRKGPRLDYHPIIRMSPNNTNPVVFSFFGIPLKLG